MLSGAGFAGYMDALFVSIALWWALANVMDGAGHADRGYVVGRHRCVGHGRPETTRRRSRATIRALKEVPDALKGR